MRTCPLPPGRRDQLEAYVKCLARAERRIILAARRRSGATIDLTRFFVQRPLIEHIEMAMCAGRYDSFIAAWTALQVKRSKFAAELEGLPWQA